MEFQRYESPTNVLAGGSVDLALDYGPGTYVYHAYGQLASGQTLRLRVLCTHNYVQTAGKYYVIDDVTISPQGALYSGYQSPPIPMLDDQWSFLIRMDLVGGVEADIEVVRIKL